MNNETKLMIAEIIYKYVNLTQRKNKGKLDWFFFQKFIFLLYLYKFYKEVQATNMVTTV